MIRCSPLLAIAFAALSSSPLPGQGINVLVFSKTVGNRHPSIEAGVAAIQQWGTVYDFGVTHTEDAAAFVNELPNHDVVLFLNTKGDILDAAQEAAFKAWYQDNKGFVGIHAATDTEHNWLWYKDMVGASFFAHPASQEATVKILDRVHPITNVIDPDTLQRLETWTLTEEWYNYAVNPRGKVHVLAVVDTLTYTGSKHPNDHPVIWCHEFDGGRSAYFTMGHAESTYALPTFRDMVINAIEWAGGELRGDNGGSIHENYEKIILEDDLSQPMSLEVAPDGKVYFVERGGAVRVHSQYTGVTTTIGNLDTYSGGEFGAMGIALEPGYDPADPATQHLYIMYSPGPPEGTMTRISRFSLDATGTLDPASEVVVLEYLANRPSNHDGSGHHQGGCLRFDGGGNLWISCGDNTDGTEYPPRDITHIMRDARKSAPNTNDLRGSILRIAPVVGGGPPEHPNYTIPAGNMFPPGTPLTRPEIYAMGCRNPFRFCIDPHTGWVYFGDVGPDARLDHTDRYLKGQRGYDEFNQLRFPGWCGWPYYIADNKAYNDLNTNPWTMASLKPDLASYFTEPVFLNNGGTPGDPELLPLPYPAWIWYDYLGAPPQFAEMTGGSGRTAMAGAVYKYAQGGNFPAYHDKTLFVMEWARNKILEVKTDAAGDVFELTRFAPHLAFSRPIDMTFGPQGAMYILEWGSDFRTGASGDTSLAMVRYTPANRTPYAIASADVTAGDTPLTVNFSSAGSGDPEDGTNVTYRWDFDGDFVTDSTDPNPQHTFTVGGTYNVQLTVTDLLGLIERDNITISAGNNAPVLTFGEPEFNGFFDWGDVVPYSFSVTDVEDGSSAGGQITPGEVLFEVSMGHDDHQHNELQLNSLAGTVRIPRNASHAFDADLSYVLDAFYTDRGASGVDPVSGSTKLVLQPKVKMAGNFDEQSGVDTEPTADAVGGFLDVTSIDHADWIMFRDFNLANIDAIRLRASVPGSGGAVQVRQDSPTGPLVATIAVATTGSGTTYADFTGTVSGAGPGIHDLYFVFQNAPSGVDLMRLNWIGFRGAGSTITAQGPRIKAVDVISSTEYRLHFDQVVDLSTSGNAGHYSLDKGGVVTGVTVAPDQRTALLTTGALNIGEYYLLGVDQVEDLAGDPIAPSTAALLVTPSATGPSGFATGINCGPTIAGALYIDSGGRVYYPDQGFSGGVAEARTFDEIANTDDDRLFRTGRRGDGGGALVYEIPVPYAGTFEVTLKFAEILFTANGARVFNVTVEGDALVTDADIHAAAGHDAAVELFTSVPVNDGSLTISLTPGAAGDPKISAIYVELAGGTNNIPDRFYGINAGGGAYTSLVDGTPYMSDSFYSPAGETAIYSGTFTGSMGDDRLFQYERSNNGNLSWQIPVRNGHYDIVLQFAEGWDGAQFAGVRRFKAHLESELLSPAPLDLAEVAGFRTAYAINHSTLISDGFLSIFLEQIAGAHNPILSALKLKGNPTGGFLLPPGFFTWLSSYPNAGVHPDADHDRDFITAIMEYALAGNPLAHDTRIMPDLVPNISGDFDYVFQRPSGATDLVYRVMASDDLRAWVQIFPNTTALDLGGGVERMTYANMRAAAVAADGYFDAEQLSFRLEVELVDP